VAEHSERLREDYLQQQAEADYLRTLVFHGGVLPRERGSSALTTS
jgi:hypothetical protein